jgi:DNA polymerase-1
VIPRPGAKLAKCDYARAEMWMGASYSGDEALIEAYYAHRDIYTEMAKELGIERQEAKILFLMLQYGAGAWKVAQFFGWPFQTVTMLEAEFGIEASQWHDREWRTYKSQRAVQVRDGFFELYPAIKAAMGIYATHFEREGILRLWTDRVIHFDRSETPAYAAWNRVIQGAVGEMVRIAMLRLEPMLAQYGAYMILQVHDELLIEYPEKYEKPVLKITKNVMEDFDFKLRPRVDISVSARNYATTEAWAA